MTNDQGESLKLQRLETPSRRSQITQTLRAAVLSGELESGVIYSAPSLAEQFGVSATPVREAMMELAREGMIEIVRYKGFRITEPTQQDFANFLEVRILLEPPLIGKLTKRGINADQRTAARHLAEATLEAAQRTDFVAHVASDIRFHLYLLSLWGNPEIEEIVRIMRSRSRLLGLRNAENREFLLQSAREHLQIVELICAGDPDKARDFVCQHIYKASLVWQNTAADTVTLTEER